MNKYLRVLIYSLIILGVVHSAFTFILFDSFNDKAFWYLGAGLMYFFMGLYNLATIKIKIRGLSVFATFLNFIGIVFTIAITKINSGIITYTALVLIIFISTICIRNLIRS